MLYWKPDVFLIRTHKRFSDFALWWVSPLEIFGRKSYFAGNWTFRFHAAVCDINSLSAGVIQNDGRKERVIRQGTWRAMEEFPREEVAGNSGMSVVQKNLENRWKPLTKIHIKRSSNLTDCSVCIKLHFRCHSHTYV